MAKPHISETTFGQDLDRLLARARLSMPAYAQEADINYKYLSQLRSNPNRRPGQAYAGLLRPFIRRNLLDLRQAQVLSLRHRAKPLTVLESAGLFPAMSREELLASIADALSLEGPISEDKHILPRISVNQVQPGYGFVRFKETLDFRELFKELKDGEELLWLDTYCPRYNDYWEELRHALFRGTTIRMLVIDPDCPNARYRAEEIDKDDHYPYEKFKAEIEAFTMELIRSLRDLEAVLGTPRCEIRVYGDLPCIPMYIIARDQKPVRGYSSFFLNKATAYFRHIEWGQGEDSLLKNMHRYFEMKWDNVVAKPDHGGRVVYP